MKNQRHETSCGWLHDHVILNLAGKGGERILLDANWQRMHAIPSFLFFWGYSQ